MLITAERKESMGEDYGKYRSEHDGEVVKQIKLDY